MLWTQYQTQAQVVRVMDSVKRLRLQGLISDLKAITLTASSEINCQPGCSTSGGSGLPFPFKADAGKATAKAGSKIVPLSDAFGPSGGGGGGGSGRGRRTHRLPSRQACSFVMAKLLIGEDEDRWLRLQHHRRRQTAGSMTCGCCGTLCGTTTGTTTASASMG